MKNKSLIIIGALLVAVMVLAVALYPTLSERASEVLETTTTEETKKPDSSYRKYTDVTVYDKDLNEVKLSDFEGKPVIINFWATWCGYCLHEMPDFEAAFKEHGDEIQFLIINTDDGITKGEKYLTENGYTLPALYDLKYNAYKTYNLSSLPRTIAIDADGNIRYNRAGMIDAAKLQSIIDTVK